METEQTGQTGDVERRKKECEQMSAALDGNRAIRYTSLIASILMIVCGVVAAGAWSAMLASDAIYRKSPITTGAGIWAGLYALVPGILGVIYLSQSINIIVRLRMFYAHFGTAMGLFGVESQLIRLSHEAMVCGTDGESKPTLACSLPSDLITLAVVCLAMGVILMATGLCVLVYYLVIILVEFKKVKVVENDGKA